jgi:hypothetical protein
MSKKFRGKLCVYCVERPATQPDHVFAREFFYAGRRDNLPKVPSCSLCNNDKSKLEHYLTSVLPFGGRHPDATANLSEMVPKRLARNAALHRRLGAGQSRAWTRFGELYIPAMTLPIDSEKIDALFRYIIKGLVWHHWRVLLAPKAGVWAGVLSAEGKALHKMLLAKNGRLHAVGNLGEGTFIYEGLQGTDIPEMSVWTFSIYGGLMLGGDPQEPQPKPSVIGGVTATKEALARFIAMGAKP